MDFENEKILKQIRNSLYRIEYFIIVLILWFTIFGVVKNGF